MVPARRRRLRDWNRSCLQGRKINPKTANLRLCIFFQVAGQNAQSCRIWPIISCALHIVKTSGKPSVWHSRGARRREGEISSLIRLDLRRIKVKLQDFSLTFIRISSACVMLTAGLGWTVCLRAPSKVALCQNSRPPAVLKQGKPERSRRK